MYTSSDQPLVIVDIGVLVFREGLECVLVLASITAGLRRLSKSYTRAVAAGVAIGFAATLVTWRVASRVLSDLSYLVPALALQAGTGLLAIIVLLVVMNWFFHKLYWTGWISYHNTRKSELLKQSRAESGSVHRAIYGMILLGFTSFYREGFEVVLFLQSYRLRLGGATVAWGVVTGTLATGMVAVLTFLAHQHLPYRKMLVATGLMLGIVLLVMVGEEAQEMQLARWLPTTEIPRLSHLIPASWGAWFSIFPTVETLTAQGLACLLVLGSYAVARSEKL